MSIDALRAAVEQAGRDRVAAVLDEARQRAQTLREAATTEVEARRRAALADEEGRLRRDASAKVTAARWSGQKQVLEARQAMLERVFELARGELAAATEAEETRSWMTTLVQQALDHMPEGPVVIECAAPLTELIQRTLDGVDDVRVEPVSELLDGFRVRNERARLVVNVTLGGLLLLRQSRLAIEVLREFDRSGDA